MAIIMAIKYAKKIQIKNEKKIIDLAFDPIKRLTKISFCLLPKATIDKFKKLIHKQAEPIDAQNRCYNQKVDSIRMHVRR